MTGPPSELWVVAKAVAGRRWLKNMFGFWKTLKKARLAQRGLTAAFEARGQNFMTMESSVHEALVKEAVATSVEATMDHFNRIEIASIRNANYIIEHYKRRSKELDPK